LHGRSGKEREKEIRNWMYREREREKDNLHQTTFGQVEIGKTYIGVGKERKKKEVRKRKKNN